MIFFDANKNKLFSLTLFMIFSFGALVFFWFTLVLGPRDLKIEKIENISSDTKAQIANNLQMVKESFSLGAEQLKDLRFSLLQAQKQEALLLATQKYLANKQASSTQENIK